MHQTIGYTRLGFLFFSAATSSTMLLSGSIPEELGNLGALERLGLSSNQLTGELCREHCHISGTIL